MIQINYMKKINKITMLKAAN